MEINLKPGDEFRITLDGVEGEIRLSRRGDKLLRLVGGPVHHLSYAQGSPYAWGAVYMEPHTIRKHKREPAVPNFGALR